MLVSAIVAMSKEGIIGIDNTIPWRLSGDMRYFKRTTMGHHIIMGRKSFDSIGKPLPKRTNIVLTRNPFLAISGCLVVHDIEEALTIAYDNQEEETFIVGGAEIYKLAWNYLDKLYITRVHANIDHNKDQDVVHFPTFKPENWKLISEEHRKSDEKNEYDYSFEIYERSLK